MHHILLLLLIFPSTYPLYLLLLSFLPLFFVLKRLEWTYDLKPKNNDIITDNRNDYLPTWFALHQSLMMTSENKIVRGLMDQFGKEKMIEMSSKLLSMFSSFSLQFVEIGFGVSGWKTPGLTLFSPYFQSNNAHFLSFLPYCHSNQTNP